MNYIVVNVVAILLATCAGLFVGAGYRILAVRPRSSLGQRGGRLPISLAITALVAEFWLASILAGALILAPQQADPWIMALGSAVVIWIGFIVPVLMVTHLFRGLSLAAALLDSGHWIAVLLAHATVLHSVGLIRVA
jgi:hypothetical protein